MHPKGISHPSDPQGCYTQWVKEANPDVVSKHKQSRDITTSEPGTAQFRIDFNCRCSGECETCQLPVITAAGARIYFLASKAKKIFKALLKFY